MSHETILKTARKRREAFKNPEKNLQTIKETVKKLDPHVEVYLFGSTAEKRHTYSSDIDVLKSQRRSRREYTMNSGKRE